MYKMPYLTLVESNAAETTVWSTWLAIGILWRKQGDDHLSR